MASWGKAQTRLGCYGSGHSGKVGNFEFFPKIFRNSYEAENNFFQDYIGGLNWGYKVELRDKSVKYINAYGYIQDGHTIKCTNKRGKEEIITTDKILIATGERPRYPDIPGVEHCISSDDLFSLQEVLEESNFL